MAISMRDEKEESVEELAQALESRLARKDEEDGLEEISLEDFQEERTSEDVRRNPREKGNPESRSRRQRQQQADTDEYLSDEGFPDEDFPDEDFPDEDFPEDDWEDEEAAPMKPWMMAAVMAGLIVLAAIICAVLWHFTHLEKEEDVPPSSTVGSEELSEGVRSGSSPSGEAASSQPVTPETTPLPESVSPSPVLPATSEPAVSPAPTVSPTPVAPQATASSGTQASTAVQEPVSGTTAMEFTQCSDEVTPKDVINLRSEPSTLNADNIVAQAQNGDILSRTGVNEATGWSRIDRDGEILYAVTQYLTTDLTYKTPVQTANPNRVNTLDGRVILFMDCNDNITPKEYVNLRTEPSTSEGETTVRCQISNGEVVHRTGYSPDAGWSRVEYNGEILYVVSSYVYTVE